ncbi:hypothetical protein ACHAPZ_004272 [Fusarium culmorum]
MQMISITYEVDRKADIELVLNNPNSQQIVPALYFSKGDNDFDDIEFDNPPCVGRYTVLRPIYNNTTSITPINSEVCMRVSSRKLIRASLMFQAMLQGPWSEAASWPVSIRQINTSKWDATALAIVMDMIHGRHRGLPKNMNLGLVARISTIVDYYQFREAVHVYLRDWLNEYARMDNLPSRLCKISLLCLYVSWVFEDKTLFSNMIHLTLIYSEGLTQIDTADLPLGSILDKIDKERQSLILYYILSLEKLEERLIKEDGCPMKQDPECTALTLGVLMRAGRKMTESAGHLEQPFDGHCVASVLDMITDIKEPSPPHDDIFRHHGSKWNRTSYPCCIGGRIHPRLAFVEGQILCFCFTNPLGDVPGVDYLAVRMTIDYWEDICNL